ncbi:acyltransferase-like protein At1g54570, chloroplastic isoform X1 [Camellia sinensis]|uniref:acyltransferase-like protein At1g54570, chloroplastic isoform X1 n=1 Tax=Camellia sinensis TaxID=4442 RepID=UPI001036681C|nr:acyltransferase-like protein At1g54570, chloroplastic isoform X1 [Camellia sinensis]
MIFKLSPAQTISPPNLTRNHFTVAHCTEGISTATHSWKSPPPQPQITDLVKFVEEIVRLEHASFPNKPIYLVGDSFGRCLALAVVACNPTINLVVMLANPASSFGRSQLLPLFPLLEAMPNELHITVPYLLSFVMDDFVAWTFRVIFWYMVKKFHFCIELI